MIKKTFLAASVVAVMCVCATPAQAQFGKALKNVGKSVGGAVTAVAGDMAADVAANKVSDNIVVFMDNNNKVSADNSAYTKRLASIVGTNYVTVDGLSLNYKVYESAEVNVLACANGCIRVYSGMMDALTDDELLATIAIQIGHIVNKDTRDALMKVASQGNAANATSAQLEKMLSFSGDKMGSIVNELIQIPYSDKQNKAADEYAFNLLKNNKKDTKALVSALQKFATMEEMDKKAETDANAPVSGAAKYTRVNTNNAACASYVSSL